MSVSYPFRSRVRDVLLGALPAAFLVALPSLAAARTSASVPRQSDAVAVVQSRQPKPMSGWVRFCDRMPGECAVDPSEPDFIRLTDTTWRTILTVNRQVNARIKPVTDQDHWGVVDRWDIPTDGRGDCEDFQLLKRRELAARGLPRRALRMTVVTDELGEGHAVLMVRTDRGDYILDNKTNAVLPWRRTGYTYLKREGADGPAWVSLGNAVGEPVTTAGR